MLSCNITLTQVNIVYIEPNSKIYQLYILWLKPLNTIAIYFIVDDICILRFQSIGIKDSKFLDT